MSAFATDESLAVGGGARRARPAAKLAGVKGKTLFARKGEASPLVDKKGGAEAPHEVVVETRAKSLRASTPAAQAGLSMINERSSEAGYPDNPSPDEVEIYEPVAADEFWADEPAPNPSPQLHEAPDAPVAANDAAEEIVAGAAAELLDGAHARGPRRRAAARVNMTAGEFLRFKLGAALLGLDEDDLVNAAISDYLDAMGVDAVEESPLLKSAAEMCETALDRE